MEEALVEVYYDGGRGGAEEEKGGCEIIDSVVGGGLYRITVLILGTAGVEKRMR